jgi:hypothetical protein
MLRRPSNLENGLRGSPSPTIFSELFESDDPEEDDRWLTKNVKCRLDWKIPLSDPIEHDHIQFQMLTKRGHGMMLTSFTRGAASTLNSHHQWNTQP